jgi:hypothetical protein
MDTPKPGDDGIREGEPPYRHNKGAEPGSEPKPESQPKSGEIVGTISLVCAVIAWLGCCLTFLGDTGQVPKGFTHNPVSFAVEALCFLTAVLGGAFAAIGSRSKSGCLALLLGLLIPVTVMGCVWLVGSGWQD